VQSQQIRTAARRRLRMVGSGEGKRRSVEAWPTPRAHAKK
jgi:hypothetical protein